MCSLFILTVSIAISTLQMKKFPRSFPKANKLQRNLGLSYHNVYILYFLSVIFLF